MNEIDRFATLRCTSCSVSTEFLPKFRLKRAAAGGITGEPAGYVCRQCQADVDPGVMARQQELSRRRQELADQQHELEAEAAPPRKPAAAGSKA